LGLGPGDLRKRGRQRREAVEDGPPRRLGQAVGVSLPGGDDAVVPERVERRRLQALRRARRHGVSDLPQQLRRAREETLVPELPHHVGLGASLAREEKRGREEERKQEKPTGPPTAGEALLLPSVPALLHRPLSRRPWPGRRGTPPAAPRRRPPASSASSPPSASPAASASA